MINFRLIRHLWLFLAVAEEQNFSRAAKRLGMSQPPLTEQIQVLEQALKVKLFDRSRRGAKLTPVGQAILPAVRKFAEQLERLELAVHEAVAGQSGVLTIGAITTAMLDVLPALIEKLKARYPQLTVSVREIDSVEAIPALEAGDIDLAFARVEGELGSSVRSIALTEDRLAVALPSDHPLAARSRISLASLAGEPLVLSSRKVSPMYFDNLIATCRASGFSPRVLHEVRSVASQIAFVSCGQGIALVPASLKKVAPSNVVLRPLSQRLNVVTTALAWNPTRTNPLVEELVAQFQGKGRVNVP
ncbi:LysR family transcriptional regulator [Pseudomonas sp. 09C 129]|jgi:DNA-binding transcriptional LysR family regulator|uniref:LysR family transcriptional regulator n=1 Tax=Pseudomonas TaxID=286 RepID=UPI000C6CA82A|nr:MULTISPECIES: LysR family transcriptional regulator [Pseudomonas]AUG02686.1 LysR family transcriptional regulator [Pseudomonas sp. 09C 129]AZD86591.1 Transcriptional regulator, LysR family [Pseudomonas chlororaphis subsp. aureofaciens]MCP1478372.1 DNA-binding transcriptional LysR family regulator [Pseudomonas chlororaphis]MCP1595276.1 DNA-binding transcriptional LysR family regulator [Pseudomonas chlororaphis]ROL89585.1 LysR family transcriptional regulator [Pseudomonas chlororaphis]